MSVIGVLFGGPSPEHDISILTGLQAARALAGAGETVRCVYWTKNSRWSLVPITSEGRSFLGAEVPGAEELDLSVPGGFSTKRRRKDVPLPLDAILNCCHGGPGEDGALGSLLALAGLRVSGPTPEAAAVLMDKFATAAAAKELGVPVIDTVAAPIHGEPARLPATPWLTKPRYGGSSIGVEADIEDLDTVRALAASGAGRAGMVLQPFLSGWQDLNVSVRRDGGEIVVSPIERPLRTSDAFYDYTGKYLTGGEGMDAAPRELPAVLPDGVAGVIEGHARQLAASLGLTGAPRIDFLWDGADQVVLCEINSIPGAWGNHLWEAGGLPKVELYRALIGEALATPVARPQWSASSDGSALRVAGSIAAKLA